MKCLKIFIVAAVRIEKIFQRQKGNGTGEEKFNEKKKENEKDVKKTNNNQYK